MALPCSGGQAEDVGTPGSGRVQRCIGGLRHYAAGRGQDRAAVWQ